MTSLPKSHIGGVTLKPEPRAFMRTRYLVSIAPEDQQVQLGILYSGDDNEAANAQRVVDSWNACAGFARPDLFAEFVDAVFPIIRANATEAQYKKARDLFDKIRGTKK